MTTDTLLELASILNQTTTFSESLHLVSQKASAIFNARGCTILMINPLSRETIKSVHHEGKVIRSPASRSLLNQISGWMIQNRSSFITSDLGHDRRFRTKNMEQDPIGSVLGALLWCRGTPIGTLILFNKYGDTGFDAADRALLEKLAIIVSPFLYNAEKIQRYFAPPLSGASLIAKYRDLGLIGKSQPFLDMLAEIEGASKSEVRVLLQGASGTGKELVARAIHQLSNRRQIPFVAIDCGAIPANLVESELFGHVKGSFTGATTDRKGLFEQADGGTLFLDEIANLPLEIQAKLMRVLQEGEVRPVGSNTSKKIDVRIISASSQFLQELMNTGVFRQDLYYRIHVLPIYVPALAERRIDIPMLVDIFIRKFSAREGKVVSSFSPLLIDFIRSREWPGNIRELEYFVERLIVMSPDGARVIDVDSLPRDFEAEFKHFLATRGQAEQQPLVEALDRVEKEIIRNMLIASDWNQSQAARRLALSEANLRFRMKRLHIVRPSEVVKEPKSGEA